MLRFDAFKTPPPSFDCHGWVHSSQVLHDSASGVDPQTCSLWSPARPLHTRPTDGNTEKHYLRYFESYASNNALIQINPKSYPGKIYGALIACVHERGCETGSGMR